MTGARYGMDILHQSGKSVKIKSLKVLYANFYVWGSYSGKLGRGALFAFPLILNRIKEKMKLKWIYSLVLCLFSRNQNLEIPANITQKLISNFSDFVQFFLISLVCSKYFVQYRSVSLIIRQIFMLQGFGRISFVACGITREFGFLLTSPFSDVSKAKNQNCLYVICF